MPYYCQQRLHYYDDSHNQYILQCYWDLIDEISLYWLVDALDLLFSVNVVAVVVARRCIVHFVDNLLKLEVLESEVLEMLMDNIDIVAVAVEYDNYYRVDCQENIYFDFGVAVAHAIAAASLTDAFDL